MSISLFKYVAILCAFTPLSGFCMNGVKLQDVVPFSEDQCLQLINSNRYSNSSSPEEQWTEEVLQRIPLVGNESVLNIGCGDGTISAKISILVPFGKVVGIDPRKNLIQDAQKKYGTERITHLYFQQENPEDISYKEEFDLVVTFSWLHLVKDQRKVIENIYKSLKPCGRLAMRFYVGNNSTRFDHAIDVVSQTDEWKEYFYPANEVLCLSNPEEFQAMLKESGFTIERQELLNTHEVFVTKEIFFEWIRPWLKAVEKPHSKQLTDNEYNQFANDVLQQYLKWHPSDAQGYIHFDDTEIEIEAQKH